MTLIQASESIFEQLISLLRKLKDEEYAAPIEILNNNSIGKHVRHIIEFYECMLECKNADDVLDYDLRKRNMVYEKYTQKTIEALFIINDKIQKVKSTSKTIYLHFMASSDGDKTIVNSTFDRELAYNIEHSIHHMAILKIALKVSFPHVQIEEDFGIAPSTIKYNNIVSQTITN